MLGRGTWLLSALTIRPHVFPRSVSLFVVVPCSLVRLPVLAWKQYRIDCFGTASWSHRLFFKSALIRKCAGHCSSPNTPVAQVSRARAKNPMSPSHTRSTGLHLRPIPIYLAPLRSSPRHDPRPNEVSKDAEARLATTLPPAFLHKPILAPSFSPLPKNDEG